MSPLILPRWNSLPTVRNVQTSLAASQPLMELNAMTCQQKLPPPGRSSEVTSADLDEDKLNVQLVTGVNTGEIFVAIDDSDEDLNLLLWDGSSMSSATQIETNMVDTDSDGTLDCAADDDDQDPHHDRFSADSESTT